jgi:hypothetical protein
LKKLICSLFFHAFVITIYAQTARKPVTAVYNNLNAYSQKNADVFSFGTNQAALAGITSFGGGVYGERRFMLNELALYNGAVTIPTRSGTFGFSGSYFGSSLNNELQAGIAYGRKLSDKISIGAGFNYFTVAVQGYGTAAAYNFEGGILFHAYNPTSSPLGKGENEFLPSIYTVGLGYEPSDKFFIAASVQKVEEEELDFNAGVAYKFDKKLLARAGFASASSSYYLGLGFQLTAFRLDAIATVHPQLGVTPGLQLLFQRKEKRSEE